MQYGITKLATDFTEKDIGDWRVRLINTLFSWFRANPDIERFYPQVDAWALEVDDDGWPQRELGLDSSGSALFGAPDAKNTGFWTDMAATQFSTSELGPMSQEQFDALWSTTHASAQQPT